MASAQGLFMLMTNGIGAFLGGAFSGWVVDHFTANGIRDWSSIWFTFAGYALVLGIIFPFVFSYKHTSEKMAVSVQGNSQRTSSNDSIHIDSNTQNEKKGNTRGGDYIDYEELE